MLINVTQAHLDAAKENPGDVCCNCPVARAIKEHTKLHVRVGLTIVKFFNDMRFFVTQRDLPDAAIAIRDAYDFGTPITGEFHLEVPQ